MLLSDVCLSVAFIGPKSERPRKTKIGTGVAHFTRDSDTTFKIKRSRSAGRFTHRSLNASGSWRFGVHRGRTGAGHIVAAARLQLVSIGLHHVSNHQLSRGVFLANRMVCRRRWAVVRTHLDRDTLVNRVNTICADLRTAWCRR